MMIMALVADTTSNYQLTVNNVFLLIRCLFSGEGIRKE